MQMEYEFTPDLSPSGGSSENFCRDCYSRKLEGRRGVAIGAMKERPALHV